MGVRGSKKRGLEALERVSVEGQWARDAARVLLVDLYKREKRWTDSYEMARQLSEKYPRNYLFRLQMADSLVSEVLALRKKKAPTAAEREQQVLSIFNSLLRDKTLDRTAIDLVNFRLNITRQQLAQR
jgi:lipopolysaccharide biosynthesis regulator YciM